MKLFILLLCVVAIGASEFCYDSVVKACAKGGERSYENCNAKYGAVDELMFELQNFANLHITRSFDYLLFSTHFATYQKNREGFEKLFRKLSDDTWEDAIDVIKYITKRGGVMDFESKKENTYMFGGQTYELSEMEGLSRVLDSQKLLALEAHHLHAEATRRREGYHDPEVASYLENKFLHKHADTIRDLAGHVNDLKNIVERKDGLPVYLFDEYLKTRY